MTYCFSLLCMCVCMGRGGGGRCTGNLCNITLKEKKKCLKEAVKDCIIHLVIKCFHPPHGSKICCMWEEKLFVSAHSAVCIHVHFHLVINQPSTDEFVTQQMPHLIKCNVNYMRTQHSTILLLLYCYVLWITTLELNHTEKNVTQLEVSLEEHVCACCSVQSNLINGVYHVNLGLLEELGWDTILLWTFIDLAFGKETHVSDLCETHASDLKSFNTSYT